MVRWVQRCRCISGTNVLLSYDMDSNIPNSSFVHVVHFCWAEWFLIGTWVVPCASAIGGRYFASSYSIDQCHWRLEIKFERNTSNAMSIRLAAIASFNATATVGIGWFLNCRASCLTLASASGVGYRNEQETWIIAIYNELLVSSVPCAIVPLEMVIDCSVPRVCT